jgi:uncharacterized iron-regulated protein
MLATLLLAVTSSCVPHRVYDTAEAQFTDFEAVAAAMARADVAFIGERHGDPATHRLQPALLEAVARRRPDVVLALEMFERDVQDAIDEYLAGQLHEAAFLERARPWPRYASDYRPMVEFAREQGWRIVASNVPRDLAARVAKEGLGILPALEPEERRWAAAEWHCPRDGYFERFAEQMREHPSADAVEPGEDAFPLDRYYEAQCLKDETMAEAIVRQLAGPRPPLVIHVNGAFHSDYRDGIVARVARRQPEARVMVMSMIPVDDLDGIPLDDHQGRADYVIFTPSPDHFPAVAWRAIALLAFLTVRVGGPLRGASASRPERGCSKMRLVGSGCSVVPGFRLGMRLRRNRSLGGGVSPALGARLEPRTTAITFYRNHFHPAQ